MATLELVWSECNRTLETNLAIRWLEGVGGLGTVVIRATT